MYGRILQTLGTTISRMLRIFGAALMIWTILLGAPQPAGAVDDPSLEYYTIETEHFYIHYYSGMEEFARRVARIQEEAYQVLTPLLDWRPDGKTHVVVSDRSDSANGSANVFQRNRIRIYAMPPEPEGTLGHYDDWLRILIYHEFTHILHLDTTSGLSAWVNRVIGKQLNPNQILPRWYTEGLATLFESRRSGTGRVNSARMQMWLRVAALDDDLFTLGQVSGSPVSWPRGSAAYLYGGFFLDYITRTYDRDFPRRFNHEYGSRIMPFSLNQTAKQVGPASFDTLWHEFSAETQGKSHAQRVAVRASGQTHLEILSKGGGQNRYPSARPAHDEVSYYRANQTSHAAFSTIDASGKTRELFWEDGASGAHDWSPDGQTIYYGKRTIRDNIYSYNDLFSRDMRSGERRQLTHNERAREPAISPDGTRVAYVRNLYGTMELALRRLDRSSHAPAEVLAGASKWSIEDPRHWQQISSPAWHPTRNLLVFSAWRLDRRTRDLWLYDFDQPPKQRLRALTHDAADELQPNFGPDGTLYFSSDRTHIFNVYAMDIDTAQVSQLSNVVSGALNPVPSSDGRWVYVTTYTTDGYEVARYLRADNPPRPAPNSYLGPVRRDYPQVDTTQWKETDYQPWRWIGPLIFTPEVAVLLEGTGFGATLEGHDPIDHHQWAVSAAWASGEAVTDRSSAVSATYRYGGWPVSIGLNAGFRTFPNTREFFAENQYLPLSERTSFTGASLSYPIRSIDDSLNFSTSTRLHRTSFFDAPKPNHQPADLEPVSPQEGWFQDINFRLSYARLNRYPQGISATDGVSAQVGVGLQYDLGEVEKNSVSFSYGATGYLSVPYLDHHVLSLGVNGGILRSNFPGSRGYGIGGYSPQDVLTAIVLQRPSRPFVLRGYPPGFSRGDQYQVWSAEYRLPIYDFERGFSTVPVFLRRIKGALFFDMGGAFSGFLRDQTYLKSAGAEVQLDTVLGYFLGGSLRLGYAHGFDPGGVDSWYLRYGGGY